MGEYWYTIRYRPHPYPYRSSLQQHRTAISFASSDHPPNFCFVRSRFSMLSIPAILLFVPHPMCLIPHRVLVKSVVCEFRKRCIFGNRRPLLLGFCFGCVGCDSCMHGLRCVHHKQIHHPRNIGSVPVDPVTGTVVKYIVRNSFWKCLVPVVQSGYVRTKKKKKLHSSKQRTSWLNKKTFL